MKSNWTSLSVINIAFKLIYITMSCYINASSFMVSLSWSDKQTVFLSSISLSLICTV